MSICQRWRDGSSCFRSAREVVDVSKLEAREIDELTAKAFVTRHHYSKRFPAARFRFGLFESGELVGVAVFSRPFLAAVVTNALGCEADEGVELGRFVLLDDVGQNAETWFLKRCRRMLRGRVLGIVSFSDPNPRTAEDGRVIFPGHVGTIYQADNARYLGTTNPATLRLLPDATVFSNMASGKIRRGLRGWKGAAAELVRFGASPLESVEDVGHRIAWLEKWRTELTRPMRHRGLHRYAWAIDRRGVNLPATVGAYPKRTQP